MDEAEDVEGGGVQGVSSQELASQRPSLNVSDVPLKM